MWQLSVLLVGGVEWAGPSLPDGEPGLGLEAAVDGLGNGRLHQVDVADHQRDEELLQVLVEDPVAQVRCWGGGTSARAHNADTHTHAHTQRLQSKNPS